MVEDFAALIRGIVDERFGGNITEAARVGRLDRSALSRAAAGKAVPSLPRLEVFLDASRVDPKKKRRALEAAEFARRPAKERAVINKHGLPTRRLGIEGGKPMQPGRRKILSNLMAKKDVAPRLYKEYIPIEGSYSEAGYLPNEYELPDDQGDFLVWGPVPTGSIAVRIDGEVETVEGRPPSRA
jgi:hypothetical protein